MRTDLGGMCFSRYMNNPFPHLYLVFFHPPLFFLHHNPLSILIPHSTFFSPYSLMPQEPFLFLNVPCIPPHLSR